MNQTNDINAVRTEQDDTTLGFRVRALKIFGGIQIGVGVSCAIVCIVGITINGLCEIDCKRIHYYFDNLRPAMDADTLLGFDIICLIFSAWCLLTGCFPFCMIHKRRNRWRCLKTAYMVCCIVGAAVVTPIIFGLGVVGSLVQGSENHDGLIAIPVILALLGLVEMIVAIVASAFCCCCSSWGSSYQNRIVYITTNNPGMIITMPQTQIPNSQIHVPLAHPATFQPTDNQSFGQTGRQYY